MAGADGLPLAVVDILNREEPGISQRLAAIQTFLERDLAQLGVRVAPPTMRRFWMMLAHHAGVPVVHGAVAAAILKRSRRNT